MTDRVEDGNPFGELWRIEHGVEARAGERLGGRRSGAGVSGAGGGTGGNGETGGTGGDWGENGANTDDTGDGGTAGKAIDRSTNVSISGIINSNTVKGTY